MRPFMRDVLVAVALLAGWTLGSEPRESVQRAPVPQQLRPAPQSVWLLAVGDVNLGRVVGQEILKGDTLYPFRYVADTLAHYDVVFGNLECQLSDQRGETQSPKNNLVFTGPPAGSRSLRQANMTIVSTANNHALDYGFVAHHQTIANLEESGIVFAGTSRDSAGLFIPTVFTRRGMRFALFACTDIMNMTNPVWRRYVAAADTGRLLPAIRKVRDSVDCVVVSYHGGNEYADAPTRRTRELARQIAGAGADLVLGHHPHVPYGLSVEGTTLVAYSLGNFVFYQPQRYWTQRSFALAAELVRDTAGVHIRATRILPVVAGRQPRFLAAGASADTIVTRVRMMSSQQAVETVSW